MASAEPSEPSEPPETPGRPVRRGAGTRGMPRAEREEQILDAATAEFGERGYHAVSMDAVAVRAGVSKPLVHAYFGTKDALYVRCTRELTGRLLAVVEPVVASRQPGVEMALETMRILFTTLLDRPRDWLLLHDATLPPGSEVDAVAQECREQMTRLGGVGVRATLTRAAGGGPPDPLDASAMNHVWQSVVTALVTWWFDHPDQTPEELTDRFGRILLALTAADG